MQYFNIQLASQLSGVASATIRAWEKRYNAVVPDRAENKHRLYSENDIEKLAVLFSLTELGQSIGKIAHLELEELKVIYTRLTHRPYEEKHVVTPNHEKIDTEKMLSNFFLALASYKLDIISHELEKAGMMLSPRELCLKILIPLFQEIGNKVYNNELNIAQEHTLSALVRFYLGQMIGQHYQKTLTRDDLILITTPEGELHEIGILGAALLCVHYGLKIIYLGANLPAESLSEAANALNPKAIILGVSRYELSNEQSFDEYLKKLKLHLTTDPTLLIGGNVKPQMRSELEKKKNQFFPSLNALDDFLSKF
jgi:DNA-binding transcriptional MerR regulator/methylmalonyl-CoA mutase cobalamin-binding subunit